MYIFYSLQFGVTSIKFSRYDNHLKVIFHQAFQNYATKDVFKQSQIRKAHSRKTEDRKVWLKEI